MKVTKSSFSGAARVYCSLFGTHYLNVGGNLYKLNDPKLHARLVNKESYKSTGHIVASALFLVLGLIFVGPFGLLALFMLFGGNRVRATVAFVLPTGHEFTAIATHEEWQILRGYLF
jgi:hypothetical protein